ncbi:50S ribosomal protein L23 [Megasphaera cerevisiae DSM 20462]|jgi:large subunit ribosomal protein L23|uniref:Large ribosomal subunit protein uL23 n=1 Tax=Megasphaera cerevisiae DSM 20462 TaxID=1122219 RepID=A0A0J6WSB5_9FIRM|nr:50S ribosomal protein L23 [Megasphaera cerevisiae]KMO85409.1 50S ribosomal protein L23 [Megasphaera cerevisiae DSM 20462]OKY54153.1 50S ribosomal protein L23 [Megasphaera cerevisiae]SKA18633.1 large subunit ribosomal protein L23 [Megasphaera cerevisiae DSM 20462]
MDMHDLLLKPVITEKTTLMMSDGKYTFKVPLHANKIEIRKAVEKIFDVKVKSVATLRTMGKFKRMGKYIGKRPDYKKAIVTLREGETIEFFEGA